MADTMITVYASKPTMADGDRLLGSDSEAANDTVNFRGDVIRTAVLGADLAAIKALAPADDSFIQRKSGVWVARTPAQVKTDLVLVKDDVGLGNVDNTADIAKPVSSAQQTALDAKQGLDSDLTALAALSPTNDDLVQRKAGAWTSRTPPQVKTDLVLVKGDVGLGNVDNTSDATKNSASVTLTNKTLTTPTIGSFVNAGHDHANAAGGGKIPFTSLNEGFSLTGNGDKLVKVNSAGNALEVADSATLRSTSELLTVASNPPYIDLTVNQVYYGGQNPARNGLLGWSFPLASATATGGQPTNGVLLLTKVWAPATINIARCFFHIDTAGVTPTAAQNWLGIYNASGVLQQSVDITSLVTSGTVRQADLPSVVALAKDDVFYIGLLFNCATTPIFRRCALAAIVNMALSGGANLIAGTYGTAQTTLPTPLTLSSISSSGALTIPVGFS